MPDWPKADIKKLAALVSKHGRKDVAARVERVTTARPGNKLDWRLREDVEWIEQRRDKLGAKKKGSLGRAIRERFEWRNRKYDNDLKSEKVFNSYVKSVKNLRDKQSKVERKYKKARAKLDMKKLRRWMKRPTKSSRK